MNIPSKSSIQFNNTRLAFQALSDRELKRMYRLFQLIDSPLLTKIGPPLVEKALNWHLPVEGIIRNTLYDIFCGGPTLEASRTRINQLQSYQIYTILDYSVEGEKNEQGFEATHRELINSLKFGGTMEAVKFVAMKVTGIADFDLLAKVQANQPLTSSEQEALSRAYARLDTLCQVAQTHNTPIFIDAEESWIQHVIDTWAEEMMLRYNHSQPVVYTTLQMYRKDRLSYLQQLIAHSKQNSYILGVKLVRGAYLEKENNRAKNRGYESPMQPNKPATDHDFNKAVDMCLAHIDHLSLCAGTHNEFSCLHLIEQMQYQHIVTNHPYIWFSQLLGMSDHISFNLAEAGYNTAKYVPYGPVKAVIPYLMRRAQENTAIAGQSSRELELLKKELKRRGI